ncbi:MAG: amidohydrolase family protein, partial [Pseudomonadota bacterium]
GTDAGVYTHGLNGRQFAYMVEWGMTPLQAIQASTIGNATLFGMDADIGSIEVGKYADLIAVRGNPLDNVQELETVDFVMKGGEVYLDMLQGR